MMRRSALCASWVMLSASSRMIILYGGQGKSLFMYEPSQVSSVTFASSAFQQHRVHSPVGVRYGELGEAFDLLSHDADTTLIGGIELQDSRLEELRSEELASEGKDG